MIEILPLRWIVFIKHFSPLESTLVCSGIARKKGTLRFTNEGDPLKMSQIQSMLAAELEYNHSA